MGYSYHLKIHDRFPHTILSEGSQDTGDNHRNMSSYTGLAGWVQDECNRLYVCNVLCTPEFCWLYRQKVACLAYIIISIQVEMSNTFLLNSVSRKFCPYYELLQRIFLSLEIHMKVAYDIKENGLQHALAQKKKFKKTKKIADGPRSRILCNSSDFRRLTTVIFV